LRAFPGAWAPPSGGRSAGAVEGVGRFQFAMAEFEGSMSLRPSTGGRRIRVMTNDPVSAGPPAASAPREVGILAVPGFELLDLAGPLSLFASATWDGSNDGPPAYRCRVIGLERGPVAAS